MKEFDIKSTMPSVEEAIHDLDNIIKLTKQNEKVIKIIHGYGSSGKGGAIRTKVRDLLKQKMVKNEIKAYIPGEATWKMMGFDQVIQTYKHLIESDEDYKKGNDGITYIIYRK